MSQQNNTDEGGFEEAPRNASASGSSARDAARTPFKLFTIEEMLNRNSNPWQVRGVFRVGEFVYLFAAPGAGKTFAAMDVALRIAAGLAWCGRPTKLGSVLYLAGEGTGFLPQRCRAWGLAHAGGLGVLKAAFRILPRAFAIHDPQEFERLLATLESLPEKPAFIVIDTQARFTSGADENSAQEMGVFVARCDRMRELTGATVLVVHHTAKDKEFERGSSAPRGAADVMLYLTRDGDEITIRGDKAKDSEELEPTRMRLVTVDLGVDEDGVPISSCRLEHVPEAASSSAAGARADPGTVICDTLRIEFAGSASGTKLKEACGLPPSTFHKHLKIEIGAGRIVPEGYRGNLTYRLVTAGGGESTPRPSPRKSTDSDGLGASSDRESHSQSKRPPKGADCGVDSESGAGRSGKRRKRAAGQSPHPSSGMAGEDAEGDANA